MLRVIYPLNLIFLVSAMIGCGGSSQPAGKNAAKTGEGKLAIQEVVKPLEWKQPLFEDVTGNLESRSLTEMAKQQPTTFRFWNRWGVALG